jgi:hypothetical protein
VIVFEIDNTLSFLKSEDVMVVEQLEDFGYVDFGSFVFVPGVVEIPAKELERVARP